MVKIECNRKHLVEVIMEKMKGSEITLEYSKRILDERIRDNLGV